MKSPMAGKYKKGYGNVLEQFENWSGVFRSRWSLICCLYDSKPTLNTH